MTRARVELWLWALAMTFGAAAVTLVFGAAHPLAGAVVGLAAIGGALVAWTRRSRVGWALPVFGFIGLAGVAGLTLGTLPALTVLTGRVTSVAAEHADPDPGAPVSMPGARPHLEYAGAHATYVNPRHGEPYHRVDVAAPLAEADWEPLSPVPAWALCTTDLPTRPGAEPDLARAMQECADVLGRPTRLLREIEGVTNTGDPEAAIAAAERAHDLREREGAPVVALWPDAEEEALAAAIATPCLLLLAWLALAWLSVRATTERAAAAPDPVEPTS